jgi:hypothetical protein
MATYNVRYAAIDSRQQPQKAAESRFHRVFEGAGTAIYENSQSPDGPYFLADISRTPNATSGRNVYIERYRPDAFKLRYEGSSPGYVVVPMSITTDWQVTVNGRQQTPVLKGGVLPTVKLSGPATIDFAYQPRVLRWFHPWLAVLITMIAIMVAADRYLGRSNDQDR